MEPTPESRVGPRRRSRLALALAAGVLVATTTGCSGSDQASIVADPAAADPAGDRFQSLWLDTAALLKQAEEADDDGEAPPRSAAEANDQLGLTAASELRFADYEADESGAADRFCLVTATNTYLTFDWTEDFNIRFHLGDGECSYDEQAAAVVGTILPSEWLKGATLMGDVPVDALLSDPSFEERLDHTAPLQPEPLPSETPGLAAAPAGEALANDARMLGAALAAYFTLEARYPDVSAAGLANRLDVRLTAGSKVRAYRVERDSFQICVTNEAAGAFATYDARLGDVASGAGNPADLLDALCGIAPAATSP